MICLCVVFWHVPCFKFFEVPGFVVWCLTLTWESSQSSLFQIFLWVLFLSLLLLIFPLCTLNTFCISATDLGYTILCGFALFISLCSFCFSVFKDSIDISCRLEIFLSSISSLLESSLKAFFISVIMLFISSISSF